MTTKAAADRKLNKDIREKILEKILGEKEKNNILIDRRAAVGVARDHIMAENIEAIFSHVFKKGYITPRTYKGKKPRTIKTQNHILLSDLHYGALLDGQANTHRYTATEEARRTGKVAYQVAEYKREHRKNCRLNVHLAGDIIHGVLHDPRDGQPLAVQIAGAVHYLTQLILYWASEYPEIHVHCTTGNHGRNKARHEKRATTDKWDSHETTVYQGVKWAISGTNVAKRVKFFIPKTPWYTFDCFGKKGFGTHGDTVLKVGYPGKNINTSNIYKQILEINKAETLPGPFKLFLAGHVHVGSEVRFPGDITFMTNGALVPPDGFANSLGVVESTCGQYMWESTPDYLVGDKRFINVDDADKEASYEDIIKPYDQVL